MAEALASESPIWTHPLVSALRVAVPLLILEASQCRGETRAMLLADWCRACAGVLGSEGDKLLYRGPRRGDTPKAFNALARGLAAAAYAPGGVTVFGLVWCSAHSPGGAQVDGPPCPVCLAVEERRDPDREVADGQR